MPSGLGSRSFSVVRQAGRWAGGWEGRQAEHRQLQAFFTKDETNDEA